MLSAFTAEPIVELKQRDKSKIESILAHGDQLLVGLSTGSLRVYRVNDPPSRPSPKNEDVSPNQSKDPEPAFKTTELLREHEKFSKYKIEQLAIFKEANILIALSNGLVSIYDLGSYELQEQLAKTKGASAFAATSNIVNDATTGVPTLVSRLAVAVRRRLLLWQWHDGDLAGDAQELALSNSIKSLTWASGQKIVVGLNSNYVMLDVESQEQKVIVGPGSIGGGPGQERGSGTLSYIGMGSMVPTPLATGLGKNEMLLAKDVNSHFIDRDGNGLGRKQIPWRAAPQAVGYSYPFLLVLQESSKGALEVRNPNSLTLLQLIELPSANLLQVPNPNISLAHQGKGFLVASDRVVWRMKGLNYDAQIDALVESGHLDEAISLLDMIEETLIHDKAGRLREIKMQKAQKLFDEMKFRDSLDLFSEVSAPPERVIRLYPESIAGELAPAKAEHQPPVQASPKKGSASLRSKASVRKMNAETASVASLRTADQPELSEKDLKMAVRELQAFLADVRRRLQRFFNPDQSVKKLSEVEMGVQGEDVNHVLEYLLGIKDTNEPDLDDKILDTAKLVDTTLFRAHMFATPSLAGSLFRISNFCDPDVVMNKLEASERYNDLIDFLYGKRLHRQALERLQKFGQAEHTEDVDPLLHGPERTVSYLQNLPPELIDLILEFAQWPLETKPSVGMEIFMADTENAESLPMNKVLSFLESIDKALALRYLEHVVDELNDSTPELHQQLVDLYLERLKQTSGPERDELQSRLHTHLRTSTQYSAAKVLSILPRDDPTFYEATAITFSKMGQHKQALQIYVFKLHDTAKAEEYCNQIHLEESLSAADQANNNVFTRRKSTTLSSLNTDPTDDQPSVYAYLLNLYLNPPLGETARVSSAIELMARHGARLPALSTLEIIPSDILVRELEFYFRGRIRHANSAMDETRIVAGLRKVEAIRVQAQLLLGEQNDNGVDTPGVKAGRQRRVRVDDERVCGVCYKRLGGSVISVFPDDSVVHLGCASRREKELSEGRN